MNQSRGIGCEQRSHSPGNVGLDKGCVRSKQAEGHVTKLLHMLLTQLATVGPIATALQSELPRAALRDVCLSREGAYHCSRPEHVPCVYI